MKSHNHLILAVTALVLTTAPVRAAETNIGAMGRITPGGGIVSVFSQSNDIIRDVRVREGDHVQRGDTLMVLDAPPTLKLDIEAARTGLEQTRRLGREAVALQEMRVRAAEIDHDFALEQLTRFDEIGGESISQQQMDERRYNVDAAKIQLESARRELERVKLDTSFSVARAEHDLDAAEAAMALTVIRAPVAGTVLEVLKNVGDRAAGMPVMRMADLSTMYVSGEVFESDVLKLKTGMKATISSSALTHSVTGVIESIGRTISGQSNIARVSIRLDETDEPSRLINMEVNIVIEQGQ